MRVVQVWKGHIIGKSRWISAVYLQLIGQESIIYHDWVNAGDGYKTLWLDVKELEGKVSGSIQREWPMTPSPC
jgi:hypothetical protein